MEAKKYKNKENIQVALRRIGYYPRLSKETIAFNADLYVNGKKVAECENHGHGGETFIHICNKENYQLYKTFIQSLPPNVYEIEPGVTIESPLTEEEYVDEMICAYVNDKEIQHFCKTAIVYKDAPNDKNIYEIKYGPIKNILETESLLRIRLLEKVDELKEKGKCILNRNIPGVE